MTRFFEQALKVKDGEQTGAGFYNARLLLIDNRLHAIEEMMADLPEIKSQIVRDAAYRIDEVLLPAIDKVRSYQEGGFLVAPILDTAEMPFTLGTQAVALAEDSREMFRPSPFVALMRASTPDDWAVAQAVSYDPQTGIIGLDIVAAHGSAGPHGDVIVSATAGSLMAQIEFLAQTKAAKDVAVAAATSAEADRIAAAASASASATDAVTASDAAAVAVAAAAAAATWDPANYAEKDSAALTGTPTAPTAARGTNTTQIATMAALFAAAIATDSPAMLAIRTLAIQAAAARVTLADGIIDAYGDLAGINAGSSANYRLVSGSLAPSLSSGAGTNVASSGQSISGGDQAGSGKANAFDGSTGTSWGSTQTGAGVAGAAYIGQDFGSSPRSIRRVVYSNPSGTTQTVSSVKVEYSDDNATWTTAVTQATSTASLAVNTVDVPESGTHRYWRLLANASPASQPWYVTDCTMLLGVVNAMAAVESAIASTVANPTKAAVTLLLAPAEMSSAVTINTDLIVSVSRDGGTTYTTVTLALLQTLPDGTRIFNGQVSFGGPSGSSMVIKMVNANAKDARIAAIAYQWGY